MLELKKENRALKSQLGGEQIKRDYDNKEAENLLQMKIDEKELKIVELSSKIQELTMKLQATEEKFDSALETEKVERDKLVAQHSSEMDTLRDELERKNSELQAMQQDKSKEGGSTTNNVEMIRSIMNQFYMKLFQSIEGKSSLSSSEVLKLTAEIIRKETKAALNTS